VSTTTTASRTMTATVVPFMPAPSKASALGGRLHAAHEPVGSFAVSHTGLAGIRTWLADRTQRSLVITGQAGIGKTALLRRVQTELAGLDDIEVVANFTERRSQLSELLHRAERLSGGATGRRAIVLIDDTEKFAPSDWAALDGFLEGCPQGRVIATGRFMHLSVPWIELAMQPVAGSADRSLTQLDDLLAADVVQVFMACMRRRTPSFTFSTEEHSAIAHACAASFGIPGEIELLAALAERYGFRTLEAALTQPGPRHHLASLVAGTELDTLAPSGDEALVLAAMFAAPGGASTELLRHVLPRSDVAAAAAALTARGLVVRCTEPSEREFGSSAHRYHVRVSGLHVAAWCAAQPDVPFAAVRLAQADYMHEQALRMRQRFYGETQATVFREFVQELPDLRGVITHLIDLGRGAKALALMCDSMPLLLRTCGADEVLPEVVRLIRTYEPADKLDQRRLALLSARVLHAAGEVEAAAVHLEMIVATPEASADMPGLDPVLLKWLVDDPANPAVTPTGVPAADGGAHIRDLSALEAWVCARRNAHDIQGQVEGVSELASRLLLAGEPGRPGEHCRALLAEAARCGDAYSAGVALLWQAAIAQQNEDAARCNGYLERALVKLRKLGTTAALSAVRTVLDRGGPGAAMPRGDVAAVVGALVLADFGASEVARGLPTVIPDLEHRFAAELGAATASRCATRGASAGLTELLGELLRVRFVCTPPGGKLSEQAVGGSTPLPNLRTSQLRDPHLLERCSMLTPREAEVAVLVATGVTNRQVANRLHISEWTVINHMRRVMQKLGCSSRTQVATWVSAADAEERVSLAAALRA
jgi:DNA-binding CsgD family transcriptional regulator